MHYFIRFESIEEGLGFIAVQLTILAVALFCECRRKELEEKLSLMLLYISQFSHKQYGSGLIISDDEYKGTAGNKGLN